MNPPQKSIQYKKNLRLAKKFSIENNIDHNSDLDFNLKYPPD